MQQGYDDITQRPFILTYYRTHFAGFNGRFRNKVEIKLGLVTVTKGNGVRTAVKQIKGTVMMEIMQ